MFLIIFCFVFFVFSSFSLKLFSRKSLETTSQNLVGKCPVITMNLLKVDNNGIRTMSHRGPNIFYEDS